MHNIADSLVDQWAQTLIQELISHRVFYFCLSPGSRSTPLALAIGSHPEAEAFVHFDERAMAFHALGYAKATRKPVAIVVTSGTAAGNLLPAIMEAHESSIPLIILTADRPPELQECGANQTTNQHGMFKNYVRWEQTLPPPDPLLSLDYLKTTIAHALAKTRGGHPGPVHLNCMFREPLFSTSFSVTSCEKAKTSLIPFKKRLYEEDKTILASFINESEKGMILLGYEALQEKDLCLFYELAEKLRWPILCDVLSNAKHHPLKILYYDLLSKTVLDETFYPDCILHFGGPFVSKHLLAFLKKASVKTYIHVTPYEKRQDPAHLITHRVSLSAEDFCQELFSSVYLHEEGEYLKKWLFLDDCVKNNLISFFSESRFGEPKFSEPHVFNALSKYNLSHHALFIGNSMPIRDATNFFHPEKAPKCIYGNRGLSGIDGNVATTIGIAKALSTPIIAILGDQTFLHDFPSLSQLKSLKHPSLFLVFNNNGGNIFSFLPIYEKKELCEAYFINPHHLTFSHAAAMFHVKYFNYHCLEDFQQNLHSILTSSHHHLIELKTHREENLSTHQTIQQLLIKYASQRNPYQETLR